MTDQDALGGVTNSDQVGHTVRSNLARRARRLKRDANQSRLLWQYAFNGRATLDWWRHRPSTSELDRALIESLRSEGVARSSVDALGCRPIFEAVLAETRSNLAHQADQIQQARETGATPAGEKSFLYELWGARPEVDLAAPGFALARALAPIARAYLRLDVEVRYVNVWLNFPTTAGPTSSQLWHRDREDRAMLKVFVYLDEVSVDQGPFRYALGSHRSSRRGPVTQLIDGVARASDDAMAAVVPPARWLQATGVAGDIVFADTAGWHCGGRATTTDRLLWTALFTAPSSESRDLLMRDRDAVPDPLFAYRRTWS